MKRIQAAAIALAATACCVGLIAVAAAWPEYFIVCGFLAGILATVYLMAREGGK